MAFSLRVVAWLDRPHSGASGESFGAIHRAFPVMAWLDRTHANLPPFGRSRCPLTLDIPGLVPTEVIQVRNDIWRRPFNVMAGLGHRKCQKGGFVPRGPRDEPYESHTFSVAASSSRIAAR